MRLCLVQVRKGGIAIEKFLDRSAKVVINKLIVYCYKVLQMVSKKRINFHAIVILLVGLTAFILCGVHPGSGDEPHGPVAKAEESCQITALPSAVAKAPIVTKSGEAFDNDRLVHAFPALDFEGTFSSHMTGKLAIWFSSHYTVELYQLNCTYRI